MSKAKPRRRGERAPERFFNRELSWLAFNARVLEEAADGSNPLLERVKFAAITASNLDEFFMVRVARLKNAVRDGDAEPDPAGLTPAQQFKAVADRVHGFVEQLYAVVNGHLLPALDAAGIHIRRVADLDDAGRAAVSVHEPQRRPAARAGGARRGAAPGRRADSAAPAAPRARAG